MVKSAMRASASRVVSSTLSFSPEWESNSCADTAKGGSIATPACDTVLHIELYHYPGWDSGTCTSALPPPLNDWLRYQEQNPLGVPMHFEQALRASCQGAPGKALIPVSTRIFPADPAEPFFTSFSAEAFSISFSPPESLLALPSNAGLLMDARR